MALLTYPRTCSCLLYSFGFLDTFTSAKMRVSLLGIIVPIYIEVSAEDSKEAELPLVSSESSDTEAPHCAENSLSSNIESDKQNSVEDQDSQLHAHDLGLPPSLAPLAPIGRRITHIYTGCFPQQRAYLHKIWIKIKPFVKRILNPPLISLLLGFTIVAIPPVRDTFFGDDAKVKLFASALKTLSSAAVPCSLVMLGNTLSQVYLCKMYMFHCTGSSSRRTWKVNFGTWRGSALAVGASNPLHCWHMLVEIHFRISR